MKASEKETGLKRLRSPASGPLFSHCASPAEPVLEQSPPAAGPKSGSQKETPATICGKRRRDVQRLEHSSMLGGEVKGWWHPQSTSAAPAGQDSCPPWGNGSVLPTVSRNHRKSLRGEVRGSRGLEEKDDSFQVGPGPQQHWPRIPRATAVSRSPRPQHSCVP